MNIVEYQCLKLDVSILSLYLKFLLIKGIFAALFFISTSYEFKLIRVETK